jgi:hypothetical protein
MTARNSLFATAFACAALCATADAQLGRPTQSRPVTAKDLAGKKICWSDGGTGMSRPMVNSLIKEVSSFPGRLESPELC